MYNYNKDLWGNRKIKKRHRRPAPDNVRSLPTKMIDCPGHPYHGFLAKVVKVKYGEVLLHIPYDRTFGVNVITSQDHIKEIWE